MILEIFLISTNTLLLSLVGYFVFDYIKIKNKFYSLKMDAEELLTEKIVENINSGENRSTCSLDGDTIQEKKRERLSSVVAGGKSKQFLGKELQLSDIDKMTPEQTEKLYAKYEARLGASMTKTLGNSFINLYVMGVSKYFKINDPPKLIKDLEEDPFLDNALNTTCCQLYYKYGMFLAPLTTILTTAKHVELKRKEEDIKEENSERCERVLCDDIKNDE